VTNIYIGIRLRKAATSRKAYYIFIAYEVFQVAMIIVLEVLRSKGIMANKGVNCKFNYSLRNESGRCGALKSDPTHHFFRSQGHYGFHSFPVVD
jgi:hypothetical protein